MRVFYLRISMQIQEIPEKDYRVHIINSIKKKYPELRQASKPVTFALTYLGTWRTLVSNLGIPEDQAKQIEARYHELYKESDEWVKQRLDSAKRDGYLTVAFGLRLRTPLLKTCILEGKNAVKYAEKEYRTAGNALGQSWCLLNSRNANEVMEKVWNSPYKTDILPVGQIHDALYFFIKDDINVLLWFNEVLIKAMEWQDHPDIWHPEVKLGGDLEIFYPDWSHGIEIPNHATKEEIVRILKNESKK